MNQIKKKDASCFETASSLRRGRDYFASRSDPGKGANRRNEVPALRASAFFASPLRRTSSPRVETKNAPFGSTSFLQRRGRDSSNLHIAFIINKLKVLLLRTPDLRFAFISSKLDCGFRSYKDKYFIL